MRGFWDWLMGLLDDAARAVSGWGWPRVVLTVLTAIAFVLVSVCFELPSLGTLRAWADAAGGWFVIAFWAAHVVIVQFPIPRTVLTLASGILFGPVTGILVALTATTVGGVLSLLIVRRLLGDWVRPRLTHPAVKRIDARLRQRGWLAVASLRMIAGVPFSILNYVAALTSIPVLPFAVATLVGSAPGTTATVLFGDTLTGDANPALIATAILLACVGLLGLVLDMRLPVKPRG